MYFIFNSQSLWIPQYDSIFQVRSNLKLEKKGNSEFKRTTKSLVSHSLLPSSIWLQTEKSKLKHCFSLRKQWIKKLMILECFACGLSKSLFLIYGAMLSHGKFSINYVDYYNDCKNIIPVSKKLINKWLFLLFSVHPYNFLYLLEK